jgi:uncharacterized membrane protein HdeD (DUF308 family)
MPNWLLAVLALQGIVLLIIGAGLFTLPTFFDTFWPWKLTALTSRAVGAWLIGIGVFVMHAVWERDYDRSKPGMLSFLAFGLLEIVALARFPSDINWAGMNTLLYVTFVLTVVAVGGYSVMHLRVSGGRN